jgi:hypothetical protein
LLISDISEFDSLVRVNFARPERVSTVFSEISRFSFNELDEKFIFGIENEGAFAPLNFGMKNCELFAFELLFFSI